MESGESFCQRSLAEVNDCSEVDAFSAGGFARRSKVIASPKMVMGNETNEMKERSEVWASKKLF